MEYVLLILACTIGISATGFPPPSEPYHRHAPLRQTIDWQPCFDNNNTQCGWFDVPLDYNDPSAGKSSLAVIRFLATQSPRLGTLFTNPGGPGNSGVQIIAGGGGAVLSGFGGGQYDIVSWDPRGVNNTVPRVDCFASATERLQFFGDSIPGPSGINARGNFTDQHDLDQFFSQVDVTDAKLQELDAKCLAMNGDILKFIGTVAVVKDLVALSDYLEGHGAPVNFWGFSYGTVIGSYFVNMFPDRVGRVIFDGVLNPVVWSVLPAHLTWGDALQSADETLEGFALACATAGPTACPLATAGSTPPHILKFVTDLIDKAFALPLNGFTSDAARRLLHDGMFQPAKWPQLAGLLFEIDRNLTAALHGHTATTKRALDALVDLLGDKHLAWSSPLKREVASDDDATEGPISCGDAADAHGVTTRDVFNEIVRVSREVSPTFGPSWKFFRMNCHRWTSRAVERFQGPWNHTLAHPILVIGNEADPITPFASAKFVADQLGHSAVLVQQDDFGHTSLAMQSICTFTIIKTYLLTGVLPSSDQFCGTDTVLFPGPPITKASLKLASAQSKTESSAVAAEDSTSKEENKTLRYAIISMSFAIALLGAGIVAQYFIYRKTIRKLGPGKNIAGQSAYRTVAPDVEQRALLHEDTQYHDLPGRK